MITNREEYIMDGCGIQDEDEKFTGVNIEEINNNMGTKLINNLIFLTGSSYIGIMMIPPEEMLKLAKFIKECAKETMRKNKDE